jgi:predicted DNA-binding protein (MmcQ/YjbR family)
MDVERARAFLLGLPHVAETVQWGDNLVFWVGDKVVGGKMFALIDLDGAGGPVIAFAAGAEHAAELCEREGFRPAPYLARAHWVAAERWDVMGAREWERELAAAHAVVWAKLPGGCVRGLRGSARRRGSLQESESIRSSQFGGDPESARLTSAAKAACHPGAYWHG